MSHSIISLGLGLGGGKSATSSGAPGGASTPLIIYTITNSGSAFYLHSSGTVDYTVDWGDGNSEPSVSNALLHTYSASGTYIINVSSDVAYRPSFDRVGATGEDQITSIEIQDGINLGTTLYRAWFGAQNMTTFSASSATSTVGIFSSTWRDGSGLTSFPALDVSSGTDFSTAWHSCAGLTSFPDLDVSSGLNFNSAWYGCTGLSSFPDLDASSGTNFSTAWRGCTALTSFPVVNVSSGTNFLGAWELCSDLTSFPALNVSSGTNFTQAWRYCYDLTSFPALNVSSGTNFNQAWRNSTSLATFPANVFDNTGSLSTSAFANAWLNCVLTAQSIENILVSLVANGATGVSLGINGGSNAAKSTWSSTAVTAYDTLIARSWTIAFNA